MFAHQMVHRSVKIELRNGGFTFRIENHWKECAFPLQFGKKFRELLVWRCVVQRFPRPIVEAGGHCVGVELGLCGERGAFGKVLTQQAVGVLVGAALPGRMRIGEEDALAGIEEKARMLGQLLALIRRSASCAEALE